MMEVAGGVCASREAPRVAADEIVGSLDLDAALAAQRITISSPAARPASRRMRTGIVTGCLLDSLLIALRSYQDVKQQL